MPCQPFINTFLIDFQLPTKNAGLLVATYRHLVPWDHTKTTAKFDLKKNVLEM